MGRTGSGDLVVVCDVKSDPLDVMCDPSNDKSSHISAKLGMIFLALLCVVFTEGLILYSRQSTHIRPLSNGQVMCVMVFSFFISLWFTILSLTLASFLKSLTTTPECAPGALSSSWRRCLYRQISEENFHSLCAAAEFSGILLIYYICDRTDLLPRLDKNYNRDIYWFVSFAIFFGSLATIRKDTPSGQHAKLLQREQTEEWKGWMQIQFLMYHYFDAKELYSAIRMYIACYVWMTGFGNFSYYYVKNDFSFARFCGMQWRLNFFVLWCCLALQNEYMLYYICMLHTTFTLFIYFGLWAFNSVNHTDIGIRSKFLVFFVVALVIWDIPGVFDMVWKPFTFLVGFNNSLHEWDFRSTLDHLIWIIGMLTAFNHPKTDAFLERLDQMHYVKQYTIKAVVVIVSLIGFSYWYRYLFMLGKRDYNALHPYTSFIPITLYIALRNISSRLRRYHIELFAWMGKITLETYISQFHIWLATNVPNGSPKKLLRLLPAGWPLMNFCLVSGFYIYFSLRIFRTSSSLKNAALPSKDPYRLKRNIVIGVVLGVSLYFLAFAMNSTTSMIK